VVRLATSEASWQGRAKEGRYEVAKHVSPAPDGSDVKQALRSFQEDSGTRCRVVMELDGDNQELVISVQAYTDHGAKVGVAHTALRYEEGGRPLIGQILAAVFTVYAKASQLAHADDKKHPTLRRR